MDEDETYARNSDCAHNFVQAQVCAQTHCPCSWVARSPASALTCLPTCPLVYEFPVYELPAADLSLGCSLGWLANYQLADGLPPAFSCSKHRAAVGQYLSIDSRAKPQAPCHCDLKRLMLLLQILRVSNDKSSNMMTTEANNEGRMSPAGCPILMVKRPVNKARLFNKHK